MSIQIYDRARETVYDEPQYGEKRLNFLYDTTPGRILLRVIFARPWYSNMNATLNSTRRSTRKIGPLVRQFNIDMNEYPGQTYTSYDSFITRKIDPAKRPVAAQPNALIAVADSRLQAYPITADGRIPVKQGSYTIAELLTDPDLAVTYEDGVCLVFRLATPDYHRYCFVDDGQVIRVRTIRGMLHSVQPVSAKRYRPLSENCRQYSVIETLNLGTVVTVEVGALLVGRIHNYEITTCRRGQEKGYFSLGGSTICLLLKSGTVKIDPDIMEYSRRHIETKVRLGEKIGEKVQA
jgi:phosphatidylserine decarboxylase